MEGPLCSTVLFLRLLANSSSCSSLQTTADCTWFSWQQGEAFRMCYLFSSCAMKIQDTKSISAEVAQCTPDLYTPMMSYRA